MIDIDGSLGEGGGQVLRTSLALSLVTGRPFRMECIRAGRERPGLLRQHLTCVRAACEIGGAEVEGAELGSTAITFRPGRVTPGSYRFAVGTAGSVALVLQSVLPALVVSDGAFEIDILGGTHADHAPPFEFLERAYLPLLARMGARVEISMSRHGFHPAGGGRISARVQPGALRPFELLERGEIVSRRARALVAFVPYAVTERELALVRGKLGLTEDECRGETVTGTAGPGNALLIEIACENATEVFSAFGSKSRSAESVAEEAVRDCRRYLAARVPVGEHLADQLILPVALAGGGSFRTLRPSRHAITNAESVRRFLEIPIRFEEEPAGTWRCDVGDAVRR